MDQNGFPKKTVRMPTGGKKLSGIILTVVIIVLVIIIGSTAGILSTTNSRLWLPLRQGNKHNRAGVHFKLPSAFRRLIRLMLTYISP